MGEAVILMAAALRATSLAAKTLGFPLVTLLARMLL
jgi:hypothetical protein